MSGASFTARRRELSATRSSVSFDDALHVADAILGARHVPCEQAARVPRGGIVLAQHHRLVERTARGHAVTRAEQRIGEDHLVLAHLRHEARGHGCGGREHRGADEGRRGE